MTNRAFKPLIENAWYIAAWSSELGEKPMARKIMNQHMVLFRDADGKPSALEDRCVHRAAPLSCGHVIKEGLQCGYHGMTFGRDGACTLNPNDSTGNLRVKSFPVVEKQKTIWIWTGDPALADPSTIMDFEYHDDEAEWPFQFGHIHFNANYMLVVDNLMDLTHLGYVHTKTIGGNPQDHDRAVMEVSETPTGSYFERWTMDSIPPPTFVDGVGFTTNIDRWSKFEYVAPASVKQFGGGIAVGRGAREDQNQEGALRLRLLHSATPETETTCHYFFSFANGYRQDDKVYSEALYNAFVPTFNEDREIIEMQQQSMMRDPGRPLIVRANHDKAVAYAHKALDRFAEAAAALEPSKVAAE